MLNILIERLRHLPQPLGFLLPLSVSLPPNSTLFNLLPTTLLLSVFSIIFQLPLTIDVVLSTGPGARES